MHRPMGPSERELSRSFRRRGALILGLFALLWSVIGTTGLTTGGLAALIGALAITGLAVFAAARKDRRATERRRAQPDNWRRKVGIVNLAQFAAIAVVLVVFVTLELPGLVPPLVCLIVGLHFFPLARLFDQPEYWTLGGMLCLFAAAGVVLLAVGAGAEWSRMVTGFGAAVTMWAVSFLLSLRAVPRRPTRQPG